MKAAAVFLLVIATIALLVLLDRPAKINPIPFRVLQEGETNPPLRQVGSNWPTSRRVLGMAKDESGTLRNRDGN